MWETIKYIPQEPNGKISILCTNKKNTTKPQGTMFNMLNTFFSLIMFHQFCPEYSGISAFRYWCLML